MMTWRRTSAPLLVGTASSVFCSWSEAATNMSEKPILIHIDINGKAHYPPKPPKPKPGHFCGSKNTAPVVMINMKRQGRCRARGRCSGHRAGCRKPKGINKSSTPQMLRTRYDRARGLTGGREALVLIYRKEVQPQGPGQSSLTTP